MNGDFISEIDCCIHAQTTHRFRFVVDGRTIIGPVRGFGGMAGPEKMHLARRRFAKGKSFSPALCEPKPGCVHVYPDWSPASDGEPMVVPLSTWDGENQENEDL